MRENTHKHGLRTALIALAVSIGCALLWAQPQKLYQEFSQRAKDMDIEDIIRFGDQMSSQGHGDSAVAVYTVAMNRYDNRLPLNEKIASIRAHQRAAEYWLSRGANLNALQVLMGARDISEAAGTAVDARTCSMTERIPLADGIYLVKIDNRTLKIMVN